MEIPAASLNSALMYSSVWASKYSNVSRVISDSDYMLEDSPPNFVHYLTVGFEAADFVTSMNMAKPNLRVLDYGSGFGRVTRALKAAFHDAKIYCFDVVPEGPNFCSKYLNTKTINTLMDLAESSIDLIWLGSVVTHLSKADIEALFFQLDRVISEGGIIIYSSHGDFVEKRMSMNPELYGMTKSSADQIITEYVNSGFGYANYPNYENYGISLITEKVHRSFFPANTYKNFQMLYRAWDNHHDVIFVQRKTVH